MTLTTLNTELFRRFRRYANGYWAAGNVVEFEAWLRELRELATRKARKDGYRLSYYQGAESLFFRVVVPQQTVWGCFNAEGWVEAHVHHQTRTISWRTVTERQARAA